MSFEKLQLIEPILKALTAEGYTTPTPIQEQSIPIILQRKDLLGCAQTGTGKTAAFAIPILQILHTENPNNKHKRSIKTLILTPTRELAIQINDSFAAYGKYLGLKHTVVFGGVSQNPQVMALRNGVDILIATPGRLLDLMSQGQVNLTQLSIFVLDEADRMLDMGFINDVQKIIAKLPPKKQTLFFSATMPPVIQKLADTILHRPEKVQVAVISSTADTVKQAVYFVDAPQKKALLAHILKDRSIASALVFTRTKHGADKVVKELAKIGIYSEAIHGNKSQNHRQNALNKFKNREIRVLIATDIAARGIDIDELSHVINYELPNTPETYVHRIGRTGRAGLSGIALSFCDIEEKEYLRDIQKLIAKQVPVIENHPFPMKNFELPEKVKPKKTRTNYDSSHSSKSTDSSRNSSSSGSPKTSGSSSPSKSYGGNRNKSSFGGRNKKD
jgi:ATP-dependent RNA helicase RhlE